MSIIGININRTNPEFTSEDFLFWMPQYTKFMDTDKGKVYFNKLLTIANNKVYKSIFGTDWEFAMSLVIAHYLTLISNQLSSPSGSTLEQIAGGGNFKGVLSQASVGSFSKSYDIDKTMSNDDEAKFWNETAYGQQYWAILKTKAIPTMMVITSDDIGV